MNDRRLRHPEAPAPSDSDRPPCFGDHERVCPRDETGIMQPQVGCLPCSVLRACLQHALRQQGLMADPFVEIPVVSKVSGFFKRWSDRKIAQTEPRLPRGEEDSS